MKTSKLLTTAMVIFSASALFAQDNSTPLDDRNELQLGLTGGANYSTLYDTKGQNFVKNGLWGFAGGGFLSIPIGTYLGLQPEVLYSEKGFSGSGVEIDGPYSFTDRMDYLDIPILIQFKPIPNLYLLGGPEYSYLLSRTYNYNQGIMSQTTQQDFNNNNINHNIFGLMFGLDIHINSFTIGGRVAWDLQDNNGDGTSTLPRYRNVWEQVTVGFRF